MVDEISSQEFISDLIDKTSPTVEALRDYSTHLHNAGYHTWSTYIANLANTYERHMIEIVEKMTV